MLRFPAEEKYDLVDRTLERAVHRLHEPGDLLDLEEFHEADEDSGILSAPPGSVADSSGIPSARATHPEITAGQSGIPSALDEVVSDRGLLLGLGERWAFDKQGHRYTIDEFGDQVAPWSTRPPGFPKDLWKDPKPYGARRISWAIRYRADLDGSDRSIRS